MNFAVKIPICKLEVRSEDCVTQPARPGRALGKGRYINGRLVKKCLHILLGCIRHSKDRINTNTDCVSGFAKLVSSSQTSES